MKLKKDMDILIVGLGLMGGSYARALTAQGYRVFAINSDPDAIDYALEQGFLAGGAASPDPALIGKADLVIFGLYPGVFLEWIAENGQYFKTGAILTDVTGVKGCIVDAVQAMLRPDVEFIAAHPMAGKEVSGVQNSDPAIFRNANYVVTPTAKNTEAAIALCEDLGRTLGFANISRLTPDEHDDMIAFVSQLTHCIAICLMTCNPNDRLQDYTGDSFRDLTRIARLNDEMWSELFLKNRIPLLRQMALFEKELANLRFLLAVGDREGIRSMMRASTARRALFDKKPLH